MTSSKNFKYKILLFFLISTIYSNSNLKIYPIFFSTYNSSGGEWHYEDKPISINGFGLGARTVLDNWAIEAQYIQIGLFGNINDDIMNFSSNQSFPYIDGSKDADGYWNEYATTKISYNKKFFRFDVGKFDRHWGPGLRAIHISNKPPSYPQFGFEWQIKDNLKLTYFHGFLKSNIPDSSLAIYYQNQFSKRSLNISRSIAAHRLEWTPLDKLTIGMNESVIYAVRGFDIHYLLAIIPLYQIENYLGDTDNVQLGCDITYTLTPKSTVYLSFFMDELTPEWIFKKDNHNWFAWQFGLNMKNILFKSDYFTCEYNWTDHRIYKHKFPVNDYYSHDQPLGFWAGPHAEEFIVSYEAQFKIMKFLSKLSIAKRGQLTEQMLEDNYNSVSYTRYTGIIPFESRIVFSNQLSRNIWNDKGSIKIGFQWIDWENAGFNPFSPNTEDVSHITKSSIEIGLTINTHELFK